MQSSKFTQSMNGKKCPVLLVEGVRALPEADRAIVVACEVWLARTFPHAVFRIGNADGTDTAFAEGIVLPYAGKFFVNAADPMKGGTGHTMQICREMKGPVFDQVIWREWLG
jgi:hypothetical protein